MLEPKQLGFDLGYELQIPYILISLREPWHWKMLSGEKRYEYRRQFIKSKCHVFIYVTGKVQGICAYAEFDNPIVGAVDEIAEIYKSELQKNATEQQQNAKGIYDYFGNRDRCFAIPIKSYHEIQKTSLIELRQKFNEFTVPQSYLYLDKKPDLLNYLLTMK